CCTRRFGALSLHARTSAVRRVLFFAALSCTLVHPARPQAPLTGAKTFGSDETKASCCSGVIFTIAQPGSGQSVAKIFPPTRKSGWHICADSVASGKLRARLRNCSSVILHSSGFNTHRKMRRGRDTDYYHSGDNPNADGHLCARRQVVSLHLSDI